MFRSHDLRTIQFFKSELREDTITCGVYATLYDPIITRFSMTGVSNSYQIRIILVSCFRLFTTVLLFSLLY